MNSSQSWSYISAALRLDYQSKRPSDCTSAIYLINEANQTGFLLTVSPHLKNLDLKNTRLSATVVNSVSSDVVEWHAVNFITSREIPELTSFIKSLSLHYTLDPDVDPGDIVKSPKTQISILAFTDNDIMEVLLKSNNRKVVIPTAATGHPHIQIESSPFALVNPALFVSYLSRGMISYIATRKGLNGIQQPIAMLSDITYLEGMEGGIACLNEEQSSSNSCQVLGVILGSLKKNSGEGKMTVIIPWDLIIKILTGTISGIDQLLSSMFSLNHSPVSSLITPPSTPPTSPSKSLDPFSNLELTPTNFKGVVAIIVSTGKLRMWGSGVLIDSTTIVTNLHVIGLNPSRITAWFSSTEQIDLSILGTPIDGIDMVFLKLNIATDYKPLIISKQKPLPGDKVQSIGYGIFYPHGMGGSFQPLCSKGIISKVFNMPLNEDYPINKSFSIPAMIITSAGCWNGSSGGAVIDDNSCLIGIMASNGRSHRSGEIISDMAFVIPNNIINYGWSLVKASKSVNASSRVKKLWKLQQTHDSIYKFKSKI